MAKPDNVARFFLYIDHLRQGKTLSFEFWKTSRLIDDREVLPIARRQFLDDIAYLKDLLPLWTPGAGLELVSEGTYGLVKTAGATRLEESEFLPFLEALVQTTNLFPFGAQAWLTHLKQTAGHPSLRAMAGRCQRRFFPSAFHRFVTSAFFDIYSGSTTPLLSRSFIL